MENRGCDRERGKETSLALEEKVSSFLKSCEDAAFGVFLCALSGGRDSVALLFSLKNLKKRFGYELRAVHVHHGLRPSADGDEAFCKALCEAWDIPLTVYHVDVSALVKAEGRSVEDAARELRYDCFEKAAAASGVEKERVKICLAHHRMDQAETVLLHLLRGSGLKGLGGMQTKRGLYYRPMLDVTPEEIEAYIDANRLSYRVDETNSDPVYTRNRVRLELLPYLEKNYNPRVVDALCALAETAAEDEACLESLMPHVEKGDLSLKGWEKLPAAVQKRTLRAWLAASGLEKDIFKVHFDALYDLANGPTGRSLCLPQGLTVQRSYDILSITDFLPEVTEKKTYRMEFQSPESFWNRFSSPDEIPDIEGEKWLSADLLTEAPVWRERQPGDYLYANGGRQKLKDFLIDRKIPRNERDRMMLLTAGSHVLWIPGYRISDAVKVTRETKTILHVWEVHDV